MKAIVFDLGDVLVRWEAWRAFAPALGGDRAAAEAFMERVDFPTLNLRCDGGECFADLAARIADPADAALLAYYVPNYAATLPEAIEGTWALMERLRAKGLQIHAITNWSAETWPIGVATHPRLGTAFGVTIVSGQEGLLKPDPRIYHLLCDRAGLRPADCLFIDDRAKNVEGARAIGMAAVQFTSPEVLETDLQAMGLL